MFIGMSEHLFSEFKNKTEIINKIKDIPLSATTVRDRAVRMAKNVTEQQFSDLKLSPVFSLACDGPCDIKNIAQLTLMFRLRVFMKNYWIYYRSKAKLEERTFAL